MTKKKLNLGLAKEINLCTYEQDIYDKINSTTGKFIKCPVRGVDINPLWLKDPAYILNVINATSSKTQLKKWYYYLGRAIVNNLSK